MSDANLTNHEWRPKMAAEGKAIYMTGKTAEERAKLNAAANKKSLRLPLDLSLVEQQERQKVANSAATYLGAAAHAFDLLA